MRPGQPPPADVAPSIHAMLGPTNTGKTHQATQRMLEHASGMMGLPLRLLAREVYDRVRAQVGDEQVALVTGEERHIPRHPRFWICTVEAMPRIAVDFLAVDEIQLAAHHERGHIFTERLLDWRGTRETWFLGAETISPMVKALVPNARIERKPRLSVLRSMGSAPLGQLPPRTAVVAFSAARVYELAERIRLKRGGAAVVLGALSPRARSAQVALYQSGEVDFMVATDAIGMGLNMNVDCVAFADLKKFDGRQTRVIEDPELAQIAGRAGRNRNDGRFCTLAPLDPLPFATQRAIEEHRFESLQRIYWRNPNLDFASTDALIRSLSLRPQAPGLVLADNAEDQQALLRLTRRGDVQELAVGKARVELLWQVCQIPDFRKLLLDDHFSLLAAVFLQLCSGGKLGADWVSRQVERLDDVSGELDSLLVRMAAIRTWTFITHRTDWLHGAHEWQERTLAIEDRLSDALHEQLVSRFVESRGRRSRSAGIARAGSPEDRTPRVKPDQTARSLSQLAGLVAVVSEAAQERAATQAWLDAPDERFVLREDGRIYDSGAPTAALAKLAPGTEFLRPEIAVVVSLPSAQQTGLRTRLVAFVQTRVNQHLGGLQDDSWPRGSRGWRALMYALRRGLGSVRLDTLDEFVFEDLTSEERIALQRLGFRKREGIGYLGRLMQGDALSLRWTLLAPHWPSKRDGAPPITLNASVSGDLAIAAGYFPHGAGWARGDNARGPRRAGVGSVTLSTRRR